MVQEPAQKSIDEQRRSVIATHEAAIKDVIAHTPLNHDALIGQLQDAMDDAKALELHDWIKDLFEGVLGRLRADHSEAGCMQLEFWLARFSKYLEGVKHFEAAAALQQEYIDRFIDNTFSRGTQLHRISELYSKAGQLESAEECLLECLALYEAMEPPANVRELAPVLSSVAQLYVAKGDLRKAESTLMRLIEMLQANRLMLGRPLLSDAVAVLASIYRRQGREDEAAAILGSIDKDAEC